MQVYAPMWFKIKCQSDFASAPLHIFETLIKQMPKLPPQI